MINFTLREKTTKRTSIRMVVWAYGKCYRIATGVSVQVSEWNSRTQRVRQTANDPLAASISNETLDKLHACATLVIAKFKSCRTPPTPQQFRKAVDIEYRGEPEPAEPALPLFLDYMQIYIERHRATKSHNTTRAITTVYNRLKAFESGRRRRITLEGVDMALYIELSAYCARYGYKEGYFATIIKIVKQVFRESRDIDKLHSFDGIDQKGFSSSSGEVDNIYLNEQELEQIHALRIDLDLLRPHYPQSRESDLLRKAESLRTARAFFLIGAYTGLRVSDFTRLGSANISDRIRIRAQKTGKETIIPIHPIVREVLEGDIDITRPPSPQKLNCALKELARLAGLVGEVEITSRIGPQTITTIRQRWEMVSNHTARRSFATNAYRAGVPTLAIMKITGHSKESTFMKYIKVGGEENAEMLENHPFFQSK